MRKKFVAGNWKMNPNYPEALELLKYLTINVPKVHSNVDVLICPPFIYLSEAKNIITRPDI
ncbi:MAG TPA: triose-phosphate isomerase, partial [Bacteroidales bacterium]|nr:triose-phosphate isomerase [Bacteroidales bacterium]